MDISGVLALGVSKKTENRLNRENRKKINRKNRIEKKPIKPINFLKKPAGSVRFRFYKQKTEKTEPNRNRQKTGKKQAKPSQTGKTEPKPEKTEPKPRKPSQNQKNRAKPV